MLERLGSPDYNVVHPYRERVAFLAFPFAYTLIYLIAPNESSKSFLQGVPISLVFL